MSAFQTEYEDEFALEAAAPHAHAGEAEEELFFNHLAAMADRGGRSQALRRIALAAARRALSGNREPAGIEGEAAAHEFVRIEPEWNPVRRVYADAQLEHLGHAAAEAETEWEAAEHFLPLIPLAAKLLLPLAAKALPLAAKFGAGLAKKALPQLIGRVAPQLTRGIGQVTRLLHANRTTRPLLHAMPRVARGTIADIARQIARTGRIDPRTAVRLLARRTAQTLSNPRVLAQQYRRSLAGDQRHHQHVARLTGVAPSTTAIDIGPRRNHCRCGAPRPCSCCGR